MSAQGVFTCENCSHDGSESEGTTLKRYILHSSLVLAFLTLLGLGSAAVGRAQGSTPVVNSQGLTWTACAEGGWECSTVSVPLDYTKPTGSSIDLAVTRLPAGDPSRRIGVLVFIAGGPGDSAVG